MHTQVELKLGDDRQIAWIPNYAAKVGNAVELKEDNQFWNVVAVFGSVDDEVVKKNERNYKSHRIGSDI